jgi:hypothetical protein
MNKSKFSNAKFDRISSEIYDEDYFEHGVQTGKSGYQNYSWLPELTMKMAHHLILELPIDNNSSVLDFGCAKGFLVKALRLLDINAYGVDISSYAIQHVDPSVRELCKLIKSASDSSIFDRDYEWLVSKDVFEHMSEDELRKLLFLSRTHVNHIFAAIPLGLDDGSGYIIPEYDRDVTHITKKPLVWWIDLFESSGWVVDKPAFSFRGVKDAWTTTWPKGNAFFTLTRRS